MKFAIALVFASLLVAFALASESLVTALTDATLSDYISKNAPVLVEFYAPWCGHCKALEPEYEAAAKELAASSIKVKLAKVDAVAPECTESAKKYGVEGFPTLKYFATASGEPVDYNGGRKKAEIVSWLTKKNGPATTAVSSASDLDTITKSIGKVEGEEDDGTAKTALLGVFASANEEFITAAKGDDSRTYYETKPNSALIGEVNKRFKLSVSSGDVLLFRDFDPTPAVLKGFKTGAELASFASKHSEPPSNVVSLTEEQFRAAIASKKPFLVEFYAPWCGYCKKFKPEYEVVATKYLDGKRITVAKVDGTAFEKLAGEEKIEGFPTTRMYKDGMVAPYKGDLKADEVIKFVEDKLNAKAEVFPNAKMFLAKHATGLVGYAKDVASVHAVAFASSNLVVGAVQSSEDKFENYRDGKLVSTFAGSAQDEKFPIWKARATVPPVFRFNDEIFEAVQTAGFDDGIGFLFVPSADDVALKQYTKVAESGAFPNVAFTFALAEDDYLLEYFALKPEDLPSLRYLKVTDGSLKPFVALDKDNLVEAKIVDAVKRGANNELDAVEFPEEEEEEEDEEEEDEDEEADEGKEEL